MSLSDLNNPILKPPGNTSGFDLPDFDHIISQCSFHTLPCSQMVEEHFSILHINARSVKNKHDDIITLLQRSGADWSVICVSETWLKEDIVQFYDIDNYTLFASCRKTGEGGGTAIYINNTFEAIRRSDLEFEMIESTFV